MWSKIKYWIALLFLLFSIGQGVGQCWLSHLTDIYKNTDNTTFRNFIDDVDTDGFGKFRNLYAVVGSNRIDKLLDPDVLRLFDRLDEGTKTRLSNNLNNEDLLRFSKDFVGASDDALRTLNNRSDLIDYWRVNRNAIRNRSYPDNAGHVSWETTSQNIELRGTLSQNKILVAVDEADSPTNSQVVVAGAYADELGGDVVIRYNNNNFDIDLLEPELKQYLDYLQMIKSDFDAGGNLYQRLYSNVTPEKIRNAGLVGKHAEVLATNEVIKQLKQAGRFNGIQDLNKIEVLTKSRRFGNMHRCPHCFQILNGVRMIGNQ